MTTQQHIIHFKDMEAKDKIQYSMSVLLIVAAIALAFTSFLISLTIGTGVLSAMALFLSSALGIYGISVYVKNQVQDMRTEVKNYLDKVKEKDK